MTTKSIDELGQQIERLVRDHLVAQRKAAAIAVERAFASAVASKTERVRSTSGRRRRAGAEMSALTERLYLAVRANPGETMTVIAAAVGETPVMLNRPMFHLKRAGRVRSAGQRNLTRYFPMTPSRSA